MAEHIATASNMREIALVTMLDHREEFTQPVEFLEAFADKLAADYAQHAPMSIGAAIDWLKPQLQALVVPYV